MSFENEMRSTGQASESDRGLSSTQIAKLETEIKILNLKLDRLIEEKAKNYTEMYKANLSEQQMQNFDPVLRQQVDSMGWLVRSHDIIS